MARITVEDCLAKIESQYDLVLLAKERTSQLNSGQKPLVPENNDKNTVVALREIGEGKVAIKTLEDSAINKLRKQQEKTEELEDLSEEHDDSFDKIYKGEISKSGAEILPSKRMRRAPEKTVLTNNDEKKEESNESPDIDLKEQKEEKKTSTDIKSE